MLFRGICTYMSKKDFPWRCYLTENSFPFNSCSTHMQLLHYCCALSHSFQIPLSRTFKCTLIHSLTIHGVIDCWPGTRARAGYDYTMARGMARYTKEWLSCEYPRPNQAKGSVHTLKHNCGTLTVDQWVFVAVSQPQVSLVMPISHCLPFM